MSFLHHYQEESSNNNITNCSVRLAGIVACSNKVSSIDFGELSCKCSKTRKDIWIIDSGASNHITFYTPHLTNIKQLSYPI